jgi:hypothetical protein
MRRGDVIRGQNVAILRCCTSTMIDELLVRGISCSERLNVPVDFVRVFCTLESCILVTVLF